MVEMGEVDHVWSPAICYPRAPATCTLAGPESLEGVRADVLDWVDCISPGNPNLVHTVRG